MTKSKSKQPEDQPKPSEQSENSAKLNVPTKASRRPVPKGFTVVEGESHIFVGGFPCAPPWKQK